MPSKENIWMKKRLGMITASELKALGSASGKIIDGNLSYIRSKRWERKHGFSHPATARAMEIGNEQEPYIYQWTVENLGIKHGGFDLIVYSKDLKEIPFWISTDCPLGASPDAYVADESVVFEFKTLVGTTAIEFFGDEYTSYEEKKLDVWKEHGDQLLGLFISNSAVEEIWLIKYIYQDDDIDADRDSPLEPWRGIVFKFARKDYSESIASMKERVRLIDAMIDAPINPSEFKKGEWRVDPATGKLQQIEKNAK